MTKYFTFISREVLDNVSFLTVGTFRQYPEAPTKEQRYNLLKKSNEKIEELYNSSLYREKKILEGMKALIIIGTNESILHSYFKNESNIKKEYTELRVFTDSLATKKIAEFYGYKSYYMAYYQLDAVYKACNGDKKLGHTKIIILSMLEPLKPLWKLTNRSELPDINCPQYGQTNFVCSYIGRADVTIFKEAIWDQESMEMLLRVSHKEDVKKKYIMPINNRTWHKGSCACTKCAGELFNRFVIENPIEREDRIRREHELSLELMDEDYNGYVQNDSDFRQYKSDSPYKAFTEYELQLKDEILKRKVNKKNE
jgi:hypothetical protein